MYVYCVYIYTYIHMYSQNESVLLYNFYRSLGRLTLRIRMIEWKQN